MSDLVETRGPARNAPPGALIDWIQHGWCEVLESIPPAPVIVKSADGREFGVPPGEVVAMRYAAEPVMATLDDSIVRYREEMGMPPPEPEPDDAWLTQPAETIPLFDAPPEDDLTILLRDVDRALGFLVQIRQRLLRLQGEQP